MHEKVAWLVIGGVCFTTFFVWLYARAPRSTKRGCIGFAIAVSLPREEVAREVLERDFVAAMKHQIQGFSTTAKCDCFELPAYYCKQVTGKKEATNLLKRVRGHCLLWGAVNVRNLNGQPNYVADLQWVVSHLPIPEPASRQFAQDVGQVWAKRYSIPLANDLLGLEFSSRYFALAIQYIVGTAAFVSQDPQCAMGLFEQLRKQIDAIPVGHDGLPPFIKRLHAKALNGFVQCNTVLHGAYFKAWRENRSSDDLNRMKEHVDRVLAADPNNYSAHLCLAIWHFVAKRDVASAKAALLPSQSNKPDVTWLYSLAFLQAYEGHLSDAYKTYKKAFNGQCQSDIPIQIEEFIHWVLDAEPARVQLHFCLGLINFYAKEDYIEAKEQFERFLTTAPADRYRKQKSVARHCLTETERVKERVY